MPTTTTTTTTRLGERLLARLELLLELSEPSFPKFHEPCHLRQHKASQPTSEGFARDITALQDCSSVWLVGGAPDKAVPALSRVLAAPYSVPPPARGDRVPPHAVATATARGNRTRLPRGRTTPTHNWKTLAFAAISIFLHVFCSAEKRLTIRTRTYRGRAPEAAPDHRT